jgi:hypothetical protein
LSAAGFIDHIGIGVPELVAKAYYDDLRISQLWARRCAGLTAVLLPGRGTGKLLTPPDRASITPEES